MTLYCSLCLYRREGPVNLAETVKDGHALCNDHLGYTSSNGFEVMLRTLRENESRQRDEDSRVKNP